MKLYQTYASPFPTRVRLLLYAKGINFDVIEPPGFGGSTAPKGEYLSINPIGRVPTLVLDDGRVLPESEVICEYLEDVHPSPALRPADPWMRARMRLLTRISDIYLVMAFVPLFDLLATPPATWDSTVIGAAVEAIAEALRYLEVHIGTQGYAVGGALTVADGALAPMLVLADEWLPATFGVPSPLPGSPRLAAYWRQVQTDPLVGRVVSETRDAILARRRARAEAQRA